MPRLKYYNETTSEWEYAVVGAQGPTGPAGPEGAQGELGVGVVTGVISQYAGSTAPTGYLLCQGQELEISSFSDLYAVVATNYGTLTNGSGGAGTTHFRIPNLQGRIPVGQDTAQTEFDVLGETGGSKTHVLTVDQMPIHTHVQNSHNHTQNSHFHILNMSTGGVQRDTLEWGTGSSATPNNTRIPTAAPVSGERTTGTRTLLRSDTQPATGTNNGTTATNQNTGGGAAHNNLQPYIVVNYIIKT